MPLAHRLRGEFCKLDRTELRVDVRSQLVLVELAGPWTQVRLVREPVVAVLLDGHAPSARIDPEPAKQIGLDRVRETLGVASGAQGLGAHGSRRHPITAHSLFASSPTDGGRATDAAPHTVAKPTEADRDRRRVRPKPCGRARPATTPTPARYQRPRSVPIPGVLGWAGGNVRARAIGMDVLRGRSCRLVEVVSGWS